METSDKKEMSIVDKMKKIEEKKKEILLAKQLTKLKKLARMIVESKEETKIILDLLLVNDEDKKKLIDFINSLEEVKLSEDDKKMIKSKVKDVMESKKKEIDEQIEKKIENLSSNSSIVNNGTGIFADDIFKSYTWPITGGVNMHMAVCDNKVTLGNNDFQLRV